MNCFRRKCFGKRTSLSCMLVLTSSFFFAEIIVGYLTNSTALIADSFHMLSDVLSIIIGFLAVTYSKKNSKYNTYGWARAEVLGALSNAVFLLALCFTIIVSAIQRLVEVEPIDNPILILAVGGAGLLVNVIGLLLFHGHTHNHGHKHSHEHTDEENGNENITEQAQSSQLNMKGVFLHVLGDALGSVVVIVSALIIHLGKGNWTFYIDPAMSLMIAGIIIWTTLPLLRESGLILLQNPPAHINKDDLLKEVEEVTGVQSIHELHVWQLAGNCIIGSAHVAMHVGDNFNETAKKINRVFHDKGIHSMTIQPEFYDCCEGKSQCGAISCNYRQDSMDPDSQSGLEIRLSPNRCPVTSDSQDLTDSFLKTTDRSDSCLLSCVSSECEEYQCCHLRKRGSGSAPPPQQENEETIGVVNESFNDTSHI